MSNTAKVPTGIEKRTQLLHLDPKSIVVVEGRNPRNDSGYGDINTLAESIKNDGVKTPIKIQSKDGQWQLLDGHRRHKALMLLISQGVQNLTVPAIRVEDGWGEKEVLLDMALSNSGKPFAPLEEAKLYQRLKDEFNMTVKEIALHVGKSLSHVSDKLAILNSDETLVEAINDGDIKPSDAITMVRKSKGDLQKQKEMVQKAKSEGTKVVTRSLTKGRMSKDQWDFAIDLVEERFSASCISANDIDIKNLVHNPDFDSAILENPDWALLYYLGQMQAVSKMANFDTINELISKTSERSAKSLNKEIKNNPRIH